MINYRSGTHCVLVINISLNSYFDKDNQQNSLTFIFILIDKCIHVFFCVF